jgi:hypothetical protein
MPDLPEVGYNSPMADSFTGFRTLIQLFHHIQRPLYLASSKRKAIGALEERYSKNAISEIQHLMELNQPGLKLKSEIQYVDILTTSAWIRSLLWQYSVSHFMLSSATSIQPLSFDYPLSIARDYLASISHVSIESVRSHGYGMVSYFIQIIQSRLTNTDPKRLHRRSSCFKWQIPSWTCYFVCQTSLYTRQLTSDHWMLFLP